MTIDTLLEPFSHFGVRLGLEAIQMLLKNLGDPQEDIPVIHVAGSNGKGSVCAYLSAVLTEAGYRVGRYTSPHLIDWTERICFDEQPIAASELERLVKKVVSIAKSQTPLPTQFEIITAAAWLYFADREVDIAVLEVGLGGRLDATNVCDHPLVSIITSISREHWQVLGSTLAEIAWEKAGILKPDCYAVIGRLPPEANTVIYRRAAELNCITTYPEPAKDLGSGWAEYRGIEEYEFQTESQDPDEIGIVHMLKSIRYWLPLQGDIQLHNSALAIAALQSLREQGWEISDEAIADGIAKAKWPARLQWVTWREHRILVDGAHNPASAGVLRSFVDSLPSQPVCWVMGMLSTKEHDTIFKTLLRPDDRLYLVPVPDHSSANPEDLATLARQICPDLADCSTYPDVITALTIATRSEQRVVLCGSLYLIGHFFKLSKLNQSGN